MMWSCSACVSSYARTVVVHCMGVEPRWVGIGWVGSWVHNQVLLAVGWVGC